MKDTTLPALIIIVFIMIKLIYDILKHVYNTYYYDENSKKIKDLILNKITNNSYKWISDAEDKSFLIIRLNDGLKLVYTSPYQNPTIRDNSLSLENSL